LPFASVDRDKSDAHRFRAELEKTPRAPERIHALTSIRFFAALYVVICHTLRSYVPFLWNDGVWGRAIGLGYISVSFFFALSGYILAFVYLRRGASVSPRKFFKARFARIYYRCFS
jgi:peptidoglycan/LPS O-acetylase OafA/YrhL